MKENATTDPMDATQAPSAQPLEAPALEIDAILLKHNLVAAVVLINEEGQVARMVKIATNWTAWEEGGEGETRGARPKPDATIIEQIMTLRAAGKMTNALQVLHGEFAQRIGLGGVLGSLLGEWAGEETEPVGTPEPENGADTEAVATHPEKTEEPAQA